MNYTKPMNTTWVTNVYQPEGNNRPAAVKPVVRPPEPNEIESMTLAEIIALATKRAENRK